MMPEADASPTWQAAAGLFRHGASITLPRNFAPLSLDGGSNEPKTPDQTFSELSLPPPPAHSTYRVRRPRIAMHNFDARNNALPTTLFASEIPSFTSSSPLRLRTTFSQPPAALNVDEPLPSIETPTANERPLLIRGASEPLGSSVLRIPSVDRQSPHTPIAQTKLATPDIKAGAWDMQRQGSVGSARSNSSTSSTESFGTRPTSFDGSATSPDCDTLDPFSPGLVNIIPDTPTRRSKKMRINTSFSRDNVEWSIEMDNHLFNVYQMYLADPTVTPFKTVPGSIPPTGVCHRVARRAKETWPRASRISVPIIKRYRVRNLLDIKRTMREKTPEPEDFLRINSTTGLGDQNNTWPSESSTRRRLKQLCREKFTITAHYQRLRESRSPSPFSEQFPKRQMPRLGATPSAEDTEIDQAGSYTTRELGISLVANDATAPLAQLMSDSDSSELRSSQDWFNEPIATSAIADKSTPGPTSAHIERLAPAAAKIPRLASPFNYSTWNGQSNRHGHRRNISHGQYDTIHATGARLYTPFQHQDQIGINANKRRAQHVLEEELSPNGSHLRLSSTTTDTDVPMGEVKAESETQLVFSGHGDINQRRIRLRNRGVTLGSAAHLNGQERIQQLFVPPIHLQGEPPAPSGVQFPVMEPPRFLPNSQSDQSGTLSVPNTEHGQRRLGSPFEVDPTRRSLRTKTTRHIPSLSDPFISTDHFGLNTRPDASFTSTNVPAMGNITERLAMFNSLHQQDQTPFQ